MPRNWTYSRKRLRSIPGYAFAHYVKSLVLWLAKEYPEAIEAAQTAVTLDPNAAYGICGDRPSRNSSSDAVNNRDWTYQTSVRPKPPRPTRRRLAHDAWALTRVAWVGVTRRLWSLSEQLTQGTDLSFPMHPFGGHLRRRRGTTAEAKLALAEARRVSTLNSLIKWFLENPHSSVRGYWQGLRRAGPAGRMICNMLRTLVRSYTARAPRCTPPEAA